jgi:hypothetical protein
MPDKKVIRSLAKKNGKDMYIIEKIIEPHGRARGTPIAWIGFGKGRVD